MRRAARLAFAVAVCVAAGPAAAIAPDEILANPALEARARAISGELRCLVCQNQSIDDSDATLARDLRLVVRDRIKAGDADEAIRTYVVQRYGEYILLRPVIAPHTVLLWAGPALIVTLAGLGLVLARRRRAVPEGPLSPDEEERIRTLGGA